MAGSAGLLGRYLNRSSACALRAWSRLNHSSHTGGNSEANNWTTFLCQGIWMYLVGLGMLWAFLLALGFLLVAPFFLGAVTFLFGWVPAVAIGMAASVFFFLVCFWWLLNGLVPLPPMLIMIWAGDFVTLVGAVVYIPQYLVACAIACYAPSLLTLRHVTLADILQSWQDLAPGTIRQLLSSLQNFFLDELVGPPAAPAAAPTTHHSRDGSITQQALPTTRDVSQMHAPDVIPSDSGRGNAVDASHAVLVESSDYSSVQAAYIIGYLPSAEPSPPASKAVASNVDHVSATAESCESDDEDGGPAEAALSTVAAIKPVLTDATPSSVGATASVFAQAGNEASMEADIITNPLYQTGLPRAAHVNTTAYPKSSDLKLNTNKASAGDCSAAAINVTANSSGDMSSASTAASPHPSQLLSQLPSVTKPAQPVAESEGTISAHYQQQQQPKRMRPSKDNIFVARREGFTEAKESGRRTEEEKARGVQRSPESILFKWGQHSSQLALAPGSKANLASTLTTPPPPMTHNAAPAPVRITVSDSPYVCKESKSAAVHGVSSNSSSSKGYKKKTCQYALDQGRKVLMAPARLMKTCFCPGHS